MEISVHDVESAPHDHCWRRIDRGSEKYGSMGRYECDVCGLTWST